MQDENYAEIYNRFIVSNSNLFLDNILFLNQIHNPMSLPVNVISEYLFFWTEYYDSRGECYMYIIMSLAKHICHVYFVMHNQAMFF